MPSGKGAKERRRLSRLPLQQKWADSKGETPSGSAEQPSAAEPGTEGEADARVAPGAAAGLASAASTGDGTAPKLLGAAACLARQWGEDNHLAHAGKPAEDAAASLASPQKATPTTSFSRRKGSEERVREAEAKAAAESAADGAGPGTAGDVHDSAAAAQPEQPKSAVPKLNLNVLSLGEAKAPPAGRSAADVAGAASTEHPDPSQRTDGQKALVLPPEAGGAATRHVAGAQASPRIATPKAQSVAQVWALAGLQYARARMHACRAHRHAAPACAHAMNKRTRNVFLSVVALL